MKNFILAKECY